MTTLKPNTVARTDSEPTEANEWMRLARASAVVIVVWSIVLQALAGLIPPVAVIGIIFLGFIPFLSGDRRKLGLAFAIVAALSIGGNLPAVIDELANPESAPAFILTLLTSIGAGLAIISGLGAFFGWSAAPIRRIGTAGAALFVAGTVLSLTLAANTVSDAVRPGDVEVVAEGVEWMPDEITVSESAGLWIDNRDGIRHTFTIPGLDVDLEVPALRSRRVELDAQPGVYQIMCEVPGHESMTGSLVVEG